MGQHPHKPNPRPSSACRRANGIVRRAGIGGRNARCGLHAAACTGTADYVAGAKPAAPRPSAPSQATAPAEPMVQIGGQQMTIPEARRHMDIRGKLGAGRSALRRRMDNTEEQAAEIRRQAEADEPNMRNKAATVRRLSTTCSPAWTAITTSYKKGKGDRRLACSGQQTARALCGNTTTSCWK